MAKQTTYYSKVIDNPDHKGYKEKRSLHRIVVSDTLKTETWRDGKWVHDSNVLAASGIGGDAKYEIIKESEVEGLKKKVDGYSK